MIKNVTIRNEIESEHRAVEELIRSAFWNVNQPGCVEHYLAHNLRQDPSFVPELDFVMYLNNKIVGNIMYVESELIDETGASKTVLNFATLSIHPLIQHRGYGKKLLNHSFAAAKRLGYESILIYGYPHVYVSSGFKSSKHYNIMSTEKNYPTCLLIKELQPFDNNQQNWIFKESDVFLYNEKEAEEFDLSFPKKEKEVLPSQEEFFIFTNSFIH